MKSIKFFTMLLFVGLFTTVSLVSAQDSFDELHGRMSRVVKDIVGRPEDNILIINPASSVGVTKGNTDAWRVMLQELKAYVDKNTSWTTSAANKKLFNSAQQQLQQLSDKLFMAVTVIYEDLIKNKHPLNIAQIDIEVQRLLQPGLAKLEEIKRALAPKSGDYEGTKKIKKMLTYFANGLYAMYERTQLDVNNLAAVAIPKRK